MDSLVELLFVLTDKALVSLLSFGKWRGEALNANEARLHAAAGSLSFVLGGRRVVTRAGLALIGMAFYGLLAGALVYWMMRG
ncbi:hypothetical protein QTI33_08870 [Variovorax sp. J22P271]|uniref:hypothetical protein n=1 Tax=Variovorax davisae TaxID=3053515 RepID=UPI002578B389|nr:hypothetical protein [Variovorax sp. J22P271]MDM0032241.1 hypothetical protein [Variovorax sp. J22P271]